MLALENADEILQILDRFTKQQSKEIPPELEEYIDYVAKTGDTVYRWPTVQYLFREKLRNVIKDFHDTTASIEDLPQCPNVDQFNYESMKTLLFERFDHFQAAPFTIQRLCELLTAPKKHYSRLDKFMRALEKNILVVSTVDPGRKPVESEENGDDSLNGDILAGINVGIEMNKNILKVDGETTNGSSNNGKASVASEAPTDEVASSSGVSKAASNEAESAQTDASKEDQSSEAIPKVNEKESETKSINTEKENKAANVKDQADTELNTSNDISQSDQTTISASDESKPQAADVEAKPAENKINVESSENVVDGGLSEANIESKSPVKEVIETEKPPTPKRACSDDEDDIIENGNQSAKKIKLDMAESKENIENNEAKVESASDVITEIKPTVDLPEKNGSNEPISTSTIDAQQENELLENVVDSVLAAEEQNTNNDPLNTESIPEVAAEAAPEPIVTNPIEASIEKTDLIAEPTIAAVSSDLIDFTPDEALNELVSADLVADAAVLQPEPVDVKIQDEEDNIAEPIVTQDEMAVEENEAATASTPIESADGENVMEAAPIKPDEEQMDVDESNSADAMDL